MKSVVITGSARGLGFCMAKLFREADYNVVISDLFEDKLVDAKNELEALRASGSMPFVSRLVEIEGSKYLDGAISDPIPFKKALEEGYEKIIVVLTRAEQDPKRKENMPYKLVYRKYPNFIKCAEKQLDIYNESLDLIREYEAKGKIIVLRPSQNLKIARVEKSLKKLAAIHKLGIDDCTKKLDEIKKYLDS